MNRFSRTAITDYDPDKEAAAVDLNVQARKLIESGALSERDYRACITLADLRKLVAAASSQAPDVLQARAAELTLDEQRMIRLGLPISAAKLVVHPKPAPVVKTHEEALKEIHAQDRKFKPSSPKNM